MEIWSSEKKELGKLHESFKGQLPELEKELEQLIKFDDPNVILLYSRRCLEVILTDLCEIELKRPRGSEPLKGIIDKLHKEHKVPDHISTSMHGLNDLSTYGTHPKDFDTEQVKPVLINLDIILKWYLKFKGFQVVVRPGPLTWVAGDYPEGQDDYPVSGVSWYEAAAYAEYEGKSLPASDFWSDAAGGIISSKIIPVSNFNYKGPEAVGKNMGIGCFGTYDMAGNVREWCWNETSTGHVIRGGAWNDASYLFGDIAQAPSFDRSEKNGFRCVQYIDKEKIPESNFLPLSYSEIPDYSKVKPADDNLFAVYKNQFLYDKTDLNSNIEATDTNNRDWTIEKITFNSAYGKERVIAYLFLPANTSPPFQTLIFFPGVGATWQTDLVKNTETKWLIDYILKDGRAVMCPVYKGMFERIDHQERVVDSGYQGRDWMIRWAKDFSRSVDYLESRSDIDLNKLGYYGYSLGAMMGGIIPAIEDRLKVNILIVGGLRGDGTMVSTVSRIKIPTLMLVGKYDYTFPYDKSIIPFYNFLGTPVQDKKLIPYDTDHYVPKNEMIKEVLAWCDKYLGPVK